MRKCVTLFPLILLVDFKDTIIIFNFLSSLHYCTINNDVTISLVPQISNVQVLTKASRVDVDKRLVNITTQVQPLVFHDHQFANSKPQKVKH